MDPEFPKTWHLTEAKAGGGVLFDLGSHAVDLARFLIGEPKSVVSVHETFMRSGPCPAPTQPPSPRARAAVRPRWPCGRGRLRLHDPRVRKRRRGLHRRVPLRLRAQELQRLRVYGSKGALKFNFERMSELQYFDFTLPLAEQGSAPSCAPRMCILPVRLVACGHPIGYEHTFVNAFYDFLCAVDKGADIYPNFGTAPTSSGSWTPASCQQAGAQGTDRRDLRTGEDKSNGLLRQPCSCSREAIGLLCSTPAGR